MPDYSHIKGEVEQEKQRKAKEIENRRKLAEEKREEQLKRKKQLEEKKALINKQGHERFVTCYYKKEVEILGLFLENTRREIEEEVRKFYKKESNCIQKKWIFAKEYVCSKSMVSIEARVYGDIDWSFEKVEDFPFILDTSPKIYVYFPDVGCLSAMLEKVNSFFKQEQIEIKKMNPYSSHRDSKEITYMENVRKNFFETRVMEKKDNLFDSFSAFFALTEFDKLKKTSRSSASDLWCDQFRFSITAELGKL